MDFNQVIEYINTNVKNNKLNLCFKLLSLTQDEKLDIIRYVGENYPDLHELYLPHNELTTLGSSLDKLVNLRYLMLFSNQIISLGNSLDKLIKLRTLILWNNQITTLGNSLDKLINLRKLDLENNNIPLVYIYNYAISTENLTIINY